MKINIAICDDENKVCAFIEGVLIKLLGEMSIWYEIDVFNSGETLCTGMKQKKYNLIFLDITMPQMNGIDVGRHIRNIQKDEKVQIVYISSHEDYAMQLFELRPFNFLIKPLNKEKIKTIIDKYMIVSGQDNHIFTYKKNFQLHNIIMSDILYFVSDKRKIQIVTLNNKDEFYDSLDNIYSKVKEHKFLYIHKSVIVNYDYIEKFENNSVTMTDGTTFSVSQSRRKEIRQKIFGMMEEK